MYNVPFTLHLVEEEVEELPRKLTPIQTLGCSMRILSGSALLESSIAGFREDDLLHFFR